MQGQTGNRLANMHGRTAGLSNYDIEKLPIETIRNIADRPKYDDSCAICLEPYKVGDRVMRLPICRHI